MWDIKTSDICHFKANKVILDIFPQFYDFVKGKKVNLILLYSESKLSLSKPLAKFLKIYRNNDSGEWLLVSPLHIKGHCISSECSCVEPSNLYLTEKKTLCKAADLNLQASVDGKITPFSKLPHSNHLSC